MQAWIAVSSAPSTRLERSTMTVQKKGRQRFPGSWPTLRQEVTDADRLRMQEGECSIMQGAGWASWARAGEADALPKMPHTPPTSFAVWALLELTSL